MTSPYLTAIEAAQYLRIRAKKEWAIQTVNLWARMKRVKALKVGHEWRFKKEWLDELKPA